MSLLHLIWRYMLRRKTRSIFTLLSILVAFVLFGYLSAINLAFSLGVDISGVDRLVLIHKVSIIQPLPFSYQSRLESMEHIVDVTHATWFGGIYQDPKNFIAQMAVDPERFLDLYPEYVLPEERKIAWAANRTGAIVGRKTADRFGWKIGDRVPIQGTIFRPSDDGNTWEFTIEGIYEGDKKGVDDTQFFFHYDYLDESRGSGKGLVGWYILRIDDPQAAAEITKEIDARFANSTYETKTTTEKAFVQAFAKQAGDIGAILRGVLIAVFFTMLLVAGNTMAQSVRERTGELAILKTLGFGDRTILGLVLAEAMLLAGIGGGLGLLISWLAIHFGGDPTGGFLAVFYFPNRDLLIGIVLVLAVGLVSGAIPALLAMRLRIVDALRRN